MAAAFDWTHLEEEILAYGLSALRTLDVQPDDPLYAVAFYGVYRELDGVISLPIIAANTRSAGAAPDEAGFWGARWSPADWKYTEVVSPTGHERMLALEKALTAYATRGTQSQWQGTLERFERVLVRTTRRLRDALSELHPTTDDVVVFWFDAEGGMPLAARTIPKSLVRRHFAPQVERSRALEATFESGDAERAALLVTRFGLFEGIDHETAQRELLAMGAPAIPALLSALDGAHGWTAAQVLGQIGKATPEVLTALRARAERRPWFPLALGMLGDHAWLIAQPPAIAATGLAARLRAIGYRDISPPPIDYDPIELYLGGDDEARTAMMEEELEPGKSFIDARPSDVDALLGGLKSAHPVIRWHAASLCGDRSLGKRAGKRVMPALVKVLEDPHPFVRRLAVFALGQWRAAARPHRAAIEALIDDDVELVGRLAKYALERVG